MQISSGQLIKETYQVVRLAAKGGMALLYEARHRELDLPVALKVLIASQETDPRQARYFMNEARALARLRHSGVPTILDLGCLAGHPFLVMEWLEGETLSSRLNRLGRLELSAVLTICAQIAEVLTAAHGHGIIHRDLKPDNIFLHQRPGSPEVVKVLDFGVARVPDALAGGESPRVQTLPGMLLGTPDYMAPEQARMDPQAMGPHTDQYALAMLAYAMLRGQPAFVLREPSLEALSMHLSAVQTQSPPALGEHVGSEVERAIRRALSKLPEERFLTVREFHMALVAAQLADASAPTRSGPQGEARPSASQEQTPAVMDAVAPPAPEPEPRPRAHKTSGWIGLAGLAILIALVMHSWGRSSVAPVAFSPLAEDASTLGTTDGATSVPAVVRVDAGASSERTLASTPIPRTAANLPARTTKPSVPNITAVSSMPRIESQLLPAIWQPVLSRAAHEAQLCRADSHWRLRIGLVRTQLVVHHPPVDLSEQAEKTFSERVMKQWLQADQSIESFPSDVVLLCP